MQGKLYGKIPARQIVEFFQRFNAQNGLVAEACVTLCFYALCDVGKIISDVVKIPGHQI